MVLNIAISVKSKVRLEVTGNIVQVHDLLGSDTEADLQKVLFHHCEIREVKGGESGVRAPLSCP